MSGGSGEYLRKLFGLDGRTAVVIGGTGTLGAAFCEALAGAGASVIVAGRNEANGVDVARRIEKDGGAAEFYSLDSTSREDLEGLIGRLRKSKRECHVLINGAGVNSATPFLEINDEEWDRILNVNLRSVKIACQAFGGYMLERGTKGSIINVASLSGIVPLSRIFTYSVSKAGVINLTQNLAREWGPQGIRVNSISPGFFPAEQNRKVLTTDRIESIMKHTPMGRFGHPSDLAGVIVWLASPLGGGFATGSNVVVDGGFMSMTI